MEKKENKWGESGRSERTIYTRLVVQDVSHIQ